VSAPALVAQAVEAFGSSSSGQIEITPTQAGNGLTLLIEIASSSVVVSSVSGGGAGWGEAGPVAPDNGKDAVVNDHETWYHLSPAAGTDTITVTLSGAPSGGFTVHVAEWTNLGAPDPLGGGYDNFSSQTAILSGAQYLSKTPCLVLAHMGWRGTQQVTLDSEQGFTALTSLPAGGSANISGRAAYKVCTYGPQRAKWTAASAISGGGYIVAFQAADADDQPIKWKADHEEQDLDQWSMPESGGGFTPGGGPETSGPGTPSVMNSSLFSRSGDRSVELEIDGEAGARIFRYAEIRDDTDGLYYSAWVYLPETYSPSVGDAFWNLFQFKSENQAGSINDNTWTLYLRRRTHPSSGPMWLRLEWAGGDMGLAGPRSTDGVANQSYAQDVELDLEEDRWTHIEVYLKQSSDFDGQITVWQDGIQVYDEQDVRTGFSHSSFPSGLKMAWSVNTYSDGIVPNPAQLYADDAAISTSRVWRLEGFGVPLHLESVSPGSLTLPTRQNEKKRVTITDQGGLGGTFALVFAGQTTSPIAYNASAATIQAALEGLSNLSVGEVVVTDAGLSGGETVDVFIEFEGQYAQQDITGVLSINSASLTGDFSASSANVQNGVGSQTGLQLTPL
jgi:polysaccharide lyase-like protein